MVHHIPLGMNEILRGRVFEKISEHEAWIFSERKKFIDRINTFRVDRDDPSSPLLSDPSAESLRRTMGMAFDQVVYLLFFKEALFKAADAGQLALSDDMIRIITGNYITPCYAALENNELIAKRTAASSPKGREDSLAYKFLGSVISAAQDTVMPLGVVEMIPEKFDRLIDTQHVLSSERIKLGANVDRTFWR